MKPIIGILPLVDTEKESYWMLPGYMKGIDMEGGLPLMLPLTTDRGSVKQMSQLCDGFLFTGGQDISPLLYGETRLPACGELVPQRDRMEEMLLEEALKRDKPVLGICRGIQFINVFLGGTLHQDIPSQMNTPLEHHQNPPYDRPVHEVSLDESAPLFALLGTKQLQVNSYHHQGIRQLSHHLRVMAAAADGLVEAVYMPDKKFVWGVQWHPEFSYQSDVNSQRIFQAFVSASAQ